jgi:hypothetical protein
MVSWTGRCHEYRLRARLEQSGLDKSVCMQIIWEKITYMEKTFGLKPWYRVLAPKARCGLHARRSSCKLSLTQGAGRVMSTLPPVHYRCSMS